ncbi:MAG TPA: preprotein translocase subunit SecE [Spirochaetota bacterium]|nr:preprotein translocase subunit SecE [Spirochaetota bacterium]OQB00351.1 MAG: preprotein translocase subunit SecE [Spirochaetes bacterium ADurb.Bin218]HON16048.1 preprotein translocase subunit SecE [Spirochaetota bacterium]HOQ11285.1 preprotein translocase subunit SecE [Spirochaetota bacterium]HOV09748.1 preprotein translocase subunit SecE [Spirochaetota bacterium]
MVAKVRELIQFFKDSREELRKVTWPDRDEVTSFTVVVVVSLVVFSLFLWLVDSGLMAIIKAVMK